jgi:hypothetical protein
MSSTAGPRTPFNTDSVDADVIKLRYGPLISGVSAFFHKSIYQLLEDDITPNPLYQQALHGGLRRYVVRYNTKTNNFDHVATYKTCRAFLKNPEYDTYNYPTSVTDTDLLNCAFGIHGVLVEEQPPSGMLETLRQVFNPPYIGSDMFIDCSSNILEVSNEGVFPLIIINECSTRVYRYGVLEDNQVRYFKNASPVSTWAGDSGVPNCV